MSVDEPENLNNSVRSNGASGADRTVPHPDDEASRDETIKNAAAEARSGLAGRMAAAGMPAEQSQDFRGAVRRLADRMRPEAVRVVIILVLAVASVVLSVMGPRLLGQATNLVVDGISAGEGVDLPALRTLLATVAGLYLASAAMAYVQARMLAGVVQRTMYRLRTSVEDKLNRLSISYVDRRPRGDLLSRVTNDIDNVQQSMQQTLSQLLTSSLTVIGVVVMMFVISPVLAMITVITIPATIATMRLITRRSKARFMAQWAHTGALNAHVEEAFTGHALVKVFGRRRDVEERFAEENDELFTSSFWAQFISGTIQPAVMFLGNLNFVAIAVIGGLRVSTGAMTIGDIQAFIQYSRQFTQPLTQLASMANVLQSGIASAERVFELLDAPEQRPDPTEPERVPVPVGRVEFDQVSFSYDPDRPLIDGLSLVVEPGTTVAIVGPTGAGKTTLVNLIMRFYELDSGAIRLDGSDISEMRRDELRSNVGMVLQDTWLFGGTIRDNIAYGKPTASDTALLEAARATYVDRFVHSLPDGYDTVVDDEGGSISAGEKQLITIARAFLAEPTILILDEATSSVDTRTEVLIQQAMAALRSNRTSFVIAHRLSTIRDADVILVMEKGRIVEQGSHEELLEKRGAYHRLYHSQFSAPASEVG